MIISADEFKQLLKASKNVPRVQYAEIASGYVSGRPQLIFDGENVPTIKKYPYLSTYSPVVGDRVQVLNGVVQGKII